MQGFLHLKYIWKFIKVVVLILISFFQMQNIINDFQDEMDDLVDGYVHHVAQNHRRVIIPRVRLDPFATPSEREFTSRYRF